jgi:SAM-dependent methyltransferase
MSITEEIMGLIQQFYPESKFGGFSDVDGTVRFYFRVNALVDAQSVVVDYGCGRGAYGEDTVPARRDLRILRGKVKRVIGLDVDLAGEQNPYVDEFHLLRDGRWSLPESSADLCVCDHVLEHLKDPGEFFSEARRVLKSGGYLCVRTPNLWNYIALVSKLVPNRSHAQVLAKVKERTRSVDVFPTLYRCNTIPAIRRCLNQSGFSHAVYGIAPEPAYLSFSRLAYRFGVLYHRYSPGFLHPVILAFAKVEKK